MKTMLAFGLFGFASCFGHYHEPSATFSGYYDNTTIFPELQMTLAHQSSLDLEDGNVFILHGLSSIHRSNLFHNELGVGYRKLGHKYGIGTNIVYFHSNLLKFNTHQLVPGIEIFGYHLTLSYNRYLPLQSLVKHKPFQYIFNDVSELCLSYRPSKKYEIGIAPFYNHQKKEFGYRGVVSAYFSDNWKVSLEPYCSKEAKGVQCSLGFHFGGAKSRENQTFNKSHRFFYTYSLMEKTKTQPFVPPKPIILPKPEPMDFPIPMPFAPPMPISIVPEPIPDPIPAKPPKVEEPERSWVDNLFFWRLLRR